MAIFVARAFQPEFCPLRLECLATVAAGRGGEEGQGLTRSREAAKGIACGVRLVNGGIPAAHLGTAVPGSPAGDFVARAFQPEHIALRF